MVIFSRFGLGKNIAHQRERITRYTRLGGIVYLVLLTLYMIYLLTQR